jgi:hypothetical protein
LSLESALADTARVEIFEAGFFYAPRWTRPFYAPR